MPQLSTVKKLYAGACPNTATTVYTAPASTTTLVSNLHVHNSHTSAVTLEIWLVAAAGSAADTNKLFQQSVDPDQTFVYERSFVMSTGDFIVAACGQTNLASFFLFGSELTTV